MSREKVSGAEKGFQARHMATDREQCGNTAAARAQHRHSVARAEYMGQQLVIWKPGLSPITREATASYELIIY